MPFEVNVVLIGFNGDGGYRYPLDGHKLEQFLKMSFPLHRPSCFETGEPIDIEHHIMYNVIAVRLHLRWSCRLFFTTMQALLSSSDINEIIASLGWTTRAYFA